MGSVSQAISCLKKRLRACICHVQDGVFRMSLSPDGTLLAVIHFSGRLSVWDVPSLKERATWGQDQQVRL